MPGEPGVWDYQPLNKGWANNGKEGWENLGQLCKSLEGGRFHYGQRGVHEKRKPEGGKTRFAQRGHILIGKTKKTGRKKRVQN